MSTVIFSIAFIVSTYASTHICDGVNSICAGNTVSCVDNELCLIQCTGSDDCMSTTVNCPTNASCAIECHDTATRDGCKMSQINATHSSSLLLDNQGVQNGFHSTPIHCPMYGNCSFIGSGTGAYKDIVVYALFGFVFNTVSLLCSGNCKQNAIMYCGNAYNSSCVFAADGISCANAPDTCDTIFTSISGTWADDYAINPAPGWIVTDYNHRQINSVFTGSLATYHGPFYGDTVQTDIEIHSLIQYFYCAYDASVFVQYFYGFSCQENVDYSRLYLNDQKVAEKHAEKDTGIAFKDDDLELFVALKCPDAWNYKMLNGTLSNVVADTYFKVQIDVALNYELETSVISEIEITCVPPTNSPTASPFPTVAVLVPSVSPTRTPSAIPTMAPSENPSGVPTTPSNAPITMIPTVSPITASPTADTVAPTKKPTIAPVTRLPTEAPVVNIVNTEENLANSGDNLMMWKDVKLQTLSTQNKDFGPLGVAICISSIFFVITVVFVCKLWWQHEKAYRPFFDKRQAEILEMMQEQHENGETQMEKEKGTADGGDYDDGASPTTN